MSKAVVTKGSGARVARHRTKAAAAGSQRVEVTVPAQDAPLVRAIAGTLRLGGLEAKRVRETLKPMVSSKMARTGIELVAFFRASPLANTELSFERDRSTGRTIEFE